MIARQVEEEQPVVFGQPSYNKICCSTEKIRYSGTIKHYNAIKGFGFIFCQALNKDIFFNKNDIRTIGTCGNFQRVSFSIIKTFRGLQAISIKF